MGVLRWIKEAIFGKPEPEPESPVFFIFGPKPKPEIWRETREEALAEWREEREECTQAQMDLIFAGEWEAAKMACREEITDDGLRRKYNEYVGWW